MSRRITGKEWGRRVIKSAASIVTGVAGGAIGSGIGCVIGNLFCPGFGGMVGMFVG